MVICINKGCFSSLIDNLQAIINFGRTLCNDNLLTTVTQPKIYLGRDPTIQISKTIFVKNIHFIKTPMYLNTKISSKEKSNPLVAPLDCRETIEDKSADTKTRTISLHNIRLVFAGF